MAHRDGQLLRWPLGSGKHPAELSLTLPASAKSLTVAPLDLGAAPGAHVAVLERWGLGDGAEAELGCVLGPAGRWVDGLQDAVLAAASTIARARGGWSSLTPAAPRPEGSQVTQPFTAVAAQDQRPVQGRHLLAFAGDPPEVLICTVACVPADGAAGDCGLLVDSMVATAVAPAPQPGLLARAAGWMAADPTTGLGLAALLSVAGLGAVLRFRPRPRKQRRRGTSGTLG